MTHERAPRLLVAVTAVAAVLALWIALTPSRGTALAGYVRIDATAQLFVGLVNPIFFGIAVYVWSRSSSAADEPTGPGSFVTLALMFLASVNVVLVSRHLLVQCLALEVSSIAAAPLIVRPGSPASRRASWDYLLFSTVALALVSLGLACWAHDASRTWHRLGLALILLGLGTKLGLAPMFTWLPEAYDEAPPAVTAMLGAVQFNAALSLLLRVVQSCGPDTEQLVNGSLISMGIVSMITSTISIVATRNLKRVLAYASINHAGVIAIGLGTGKAGTYGLLLYALSNAYIKAILFLTAGRIKSHYRTKDTTRIRGLIRDLPYSGVFLMVGTFALLGFPPFGSFVGELLILSALVSTDRLLVFATFCALITMTFVATARTIFPMIWGESPEKREWPRERFALIAIKIGILVALVALGIYIPPGLNELILEVARGGGAP